MVLVAQVQSAALPHLSRVKSPQQINGTLIKYGSEACHHTPPERIYHVAVMPCFDKKLEVMMKRSFGAHDKISSGAH